MTTAALRASLARKAEPTTFKEILLSKISFQKRQKEMKRQEKQRMKAAKRAQRKIAKNSEPKASAQDSSPTRLTITDASDKPSDFPWTKGMWSAADES
jgi:hypothetical protein